MFDSYEAGYAPYQSLHAEILRSRFANNKRHLVALILEANRDNPLFRAPIGEDPKQILDLGTGKGTWAM